MGRLSVSSVHWCILKIVNLFLFAAIERNNLMRLSQTIPFTPIQLFGECVISTFLRLCQGRGIAAEEVIGETLLHRLR